MDKYDFEIEKLMAMTPETFNREIKMEWVNATPLFKFLGLEPSRLGCPTQCKQLIANCGHTTGSISEQAAGDSPIIPAMFTGIKQDRVMLNEFARIQRIADEENS